MEGDSAFHSTMSDRPKIPIGDAFGRYMRERREAAGVSLRDLGNSLGVTHQYLGEVERAVRGPIREQLWPNLAAAIPGMTQEGLSTAASLSRGLRVNVASVPGAWAAVLAELVPAIGTDSASLETAEAVLAVLRSRPPRHACEAEAGAERKLGAPRRRAGAKAETMDQEVNA